MAANKTYLIAHTASTESKDIAQKQVSATSEARARNIFKRDHPDRAVQVVGVKGSEG